MKNNKNTQTKQPPKFTISMQKKVLVLFGLLMVVFVGLSIRLVWINREDGDRYQRQVLSQQEYDSVTLPYRRGSIVDSKGTVLAVSEKIYNLVIDAKVMTDKEDYLEPTLSALAACFPTLDMTAIRTYITEHSKTSGSPSSYYVPIKQMTFDEISDFKTMATKDSKIKGVWFEEQYKRMYPNGSMACDLIGFTTSDNVGMYGLEEYYNDVLSGTTGREYGYLNDDSNLERTTKPAVDGYNIVTTIDANIQTIVEKCLRNFNEEYTDNVREGNGANNVGAIVMEVDTGNVLAMASYPTYDLNSPYDLSSYYTQEEVDAMKESDTYFETLNELWKNFCISSTYEPGSTYKPFTVAAALESGKITGNEVYHCGGSLNVGGHDIHCHNRVGDGEVSVERAIAISCNVALMQIAETVGINTFAKFQQEFNFGLKTNIDLAGEARTASLVYTADTMGPTEMATGSFGQSFNVTMIQMISGFCSLINGGYYYEPHVVSRLETSGGAVVDNIETRLLKQTISETTSAMIREYCEAVCDPTVTGNTGKTARPAGYAIGGKTGTAQTLPRGNGEYVVSFIGYAPADDPQIAVYVVVDRPNVADQSNGTRCATVINRNIMTEVLPYLGIFMTEELSDAERKELEEKQIEITNMYAPSVSDGDAGTDVSGNETAGDTVPLWMTYEKDPETGNYIDPNNGDQLDPETGNVIGGGYPAITQD